MLSDPHLTAFEITTRGQESLHAITTRQSPLKNGGRSFSALSCGATNRISTGKADWPDKSRQHMLSELAIAMRPFHPESAESIDGK